MNGPVLWESRAGAQNKIIQTDGGGEKAEDRGLREIEGDMAL
jgi:hypothetical protein